MKKVILALLLFLSSATFACPNLEGSFYYSPTSTIDVVQHLDDQGVTIYKMTIDDHNCAVCKFDQIFKADGITDVREGDSRKEFTTISCENNRLKFRYTVDTVNEIGETVASYSNFLDYRINSDNNLVEETIKYGAPYSKVVYPRLNP